MRRPAKYLNLKRARIRQSWNKHNLYNLVMMTGGVDANSRRTFFQQKWAAKSMTRGYHGEHIPEKKWTRMFSRRLSAAVDMPPEYLAKHDGSEQGAGRGSGLTTNTVSATNYSQEYGRRPRKLNPAHFKMNFGGHTVQTKLLTEGMADKITPSMQMVYAPLERRLDTAIFRSLFATSIRQARQMVVHGAVTVNGKKMNYPAYQLNPGDMFQVNPVKVLTATAAQKSGEPNARVKKMMNQNKKKYAQFEARYKLLQERRSARGVDEKYDSPLPLELPESAASTEVASEEAQVEEPATEEAQSEVAAAETAAETATETPEKKSGMTPADKEREQVKLETVLIDAKIVVRQDWGKEENLDKRGGVKHQAGQEKKLSNDELVFHFASFRDRVANYFGTAHYYGEKAPHFGDTTRKLPPSILVGKLVNRMRKLDMLQEGETEPPTHLLSKALEIDGANWKSHNHILERAEERGMTLGEMKRMGELMAENADGRVDDKTPYATPWQPRAWMKPWVFIPRYLEVNHKICASVYLRHPVARKGQGEVPTPFHYFSNQLAHAWYVTKGVSKFKHKPQ